MAARANLDESRTICAVEALVRRGILLRQLSGQDGRSVVISLSEEGEVLYRKANAIAQQRNAALLSALYEEDGPRSGKCANRRAGSTVWSSRIDSKRI